MQVCRWGKRLCRWGKRLEHLLLEGIAREGDDTAGESDRHLLEGNAPELGREQQLGVHLRQPGHTDTEHRRLAQRTCSIPD